MQNRNQHLVMLCRVQRKEMWKGEPGRAGPAGPPGPPGPTMVVGYGGGFGMNPYMMPPMMNPYMMPPIMGGMLPGMTGAVPSSAPPSVAMPNMTAVMEIQNLGNQGGGMSPTRHFGSMNFLGQLFKESWDYLFHQIHQRILQYCTFDCCVAEINDPDPLSTNHKRLDSNKTWSL